MKLYLARHGDSLPAGADDERPLSEQGVSDIKRLADFILPLKLQVSRIIHSQKYRAKQTAGILAASIQSLEPMESTVALDPLASVDPMIDDLYAERKEMLWVGHLPFMERVVGKLVAGDENKNRVAFGTGSLVCLEEAEGGRWIICWMVVPELLNKIHFRN